MYTEEDKRDMRQMFDDYIRLRIRELIEGIEESASNAKWWLGESRRYPHGCWERDFKVSFDDIQKRVSEIEGLLAKNETGKDLMEQGIYSMADYKDKVGDEEEYNDDDEDDAVYALTDKGRLAAMLNDPKYNLIDGDAPIYGAIVQVLKDTYEAEYKPKDEEEE